MNFMVGIVGFGVIVIVLLIIPYRSALNCVQTNECLYGRACIRRVDRVHVRQSVYCQLGNNCSIFEFILVSCVLFHLIRLGSYACFVVDELIVQFMKRENASEIIYFRGDVCVRRRDVC